jgi:hypothetical protein
VVHAGEDVDQGRLSGPVLTQQRVDLAGAQLEVDVVVGENARKRLRDPAQLAERRRLRYGLDVVLGCQLGSCGRAGLDAPARPGCAFG